MAKKEWYEIIVTCVKEAPSIDCRLGESFTVAKVKSVGNAYVVTEALRETYGKYFTVYYK